VFGTVSGLAYDRAVEILVRFRPSGRSVRIPRGTTLLEAARRASLPLASACGAEGLCGRCGIRILAGADSLPPESGDEARVKRLNRVDAAERLACRAVPRGDVEVTARYW
jgi:adenylate cyclase